MRHWNRVLGGLGSLFVLAGTTPSFAGDGRIELTGDRSEISFSMYVAAPAVSQAEYDHIRQTLEDANRYVCDSTDGRFHLSKVDLVTGDKVRGNAGRLVVSDERPGTFEHDGQLRRSAESDAAG